MGLWRWFRGKPPTPSPAELRVLARSRARSVCAIRADPSLLFEVVAGAPCECECRASACESRVCDCGAALSGEVLFVDLLIKKKTVHERDLLSVAGLDWFRLSSRLPLSAAALERHAGDVDWARVSWSSLYAKDAAFVRAFAERLHWRLVRRADSAEVARQLFERGLRCADAALSNRLVDVADLAQHVEALRASPRLSALVVDSYRARDADALGLDVPEHLRHAVAAKCIRERFVPAAAPLVAALEAICAVFDDATLEAHVRAGDARAREVVSRHARLSPEFVDRNADALDWYALCEFQALPEWLLRKHVDRLNWGQLSRYQELSPAFEAEFAARINWVKRGALAAPLTQWGGGPTGRIFGRQ
jgi:hypothetical protein